jgi:hypothetical protein
MFKPLDAVMREATKCENAFSCLKTGRCGNREMCAATCSFGPRVLQLATKDQTICAYRVSFGYGQLCTCPVRNYLHACGSPAAFEDCIPVAMPSAQTA